MSSKNGWLWAVGISSVLGPPAMTRGRKPAPPAEAEPEPEPPDEPDGQVEYRGNVKSLAFHQPGCRYYDGADCTAVFTSRDQALEAGYKPCKVCKP